MTEKIRFCVVSLLLTLKACKSAVTISQIPGEVEENDFVQFICTVPPAQISSTVKFFQNNIQKGQCTAPIPNVGPGTCNSNMYQDPSTGSTWYNISSAKDTNLGPWRCEHGVDNSNVINALIVFKGTVTNNMASLPSIINNLNVALIVEIGCSYPKPTVQWKVQVCTQPELMNVVTNPDVMENSSVSCASPRKAYTSSIQVKDLANPSSTTCFKPSAFISYATNLQADSIMFTTQVNIEGIPPSSSIFSFKCVLVIIIALVVLIVVIVFCCSNKSCKTYETCWRCEGACYSDYPVADQKSSKEWYINCYCKSKDPCLCKILSRMCCSVFMCGGKCLLEFPAVRSMENGKRLTETPKNTDTGGKANTKTLEPIQGGVNKLDINGTLTPRQLPILPPISK